MCEDGKLHYKIPSFTVRSQPFISLLVISDEEEAQENAQDEADHDRAGDDGKDSFPKISPTFIL